MSRPCDQVGPHGLAPTLEDLAAAYRAEAGPQPPQLRGEAVAVGDDLITVLCTADAGDGREHMRLLSLAGDGTLRSQRRYPPDHGVGLGLAVAERGQLLVAGEARQERPRYRALLMRVAPDGHVIARRRLDTDRVSGFVAVAALSDGSVVAGGACGGHGLHAVFDAELRERREELPATDEVVSVTALGDGYAIVAVEQRSTTSLGTALVAALTQDGRSCWELRLPADGRGELPATAPLDADRLVLAGHIEHDADTRLWALIAGADGSIEWEQQLELPGAGWRARGVAVLGGGLIVVAGDARHDANRRTHVAWLDQAGAPLLRRELTPGGNLDEVVAGTAPVGDDQVVVAGTRSAPNSGEARLVVRLLEVDGNILWEHTFAA